MDDGVDYMHPDLIHNYVSWHFLAIKWLLSRNLSHITFFSMLWLSKTRRTVFVRKLIAILFKFTNYNLGKRSRLEGTYSFAFSKRINCINTFSKKSNIDIDESRLYRNHRWYASRKKYVVHIKVLKGKSKELKVNVYFTPCSNMFRLYGLNPLNYRWQSFEFYKLNSNESKCTLFWSWFSEISRKLMIYDFQTNRPAYKKSKENFCNENGFFQNARASYDFSSNDPYPYPRYTDDWFNSHGTRCAGEVAGARDNGVCGTGVAYDSMVAGEVSRYWAV